MRLTADYDYELPEALIAQAPADRRDGSRLLAVAQRDGEFADAAFAELEAHLPEDAVVVVNDAKVRRARLGCVKEASGGAVELLLLEPVGDGWLAMARASKPIRAGARLVTRSGAIVTVTRERDGAGHILVALAEPADALCDRDGELPLPPYIRRPDGPTRADAGRYQTVYATAPGAIAAPTAGLHFSPNLVSRLQASGREWAPLTLHVGLGTFSPIRADRVADIELHAERYEIPERTAALVGSGRPVVAVGTTVVRALEAAALEGRSHGSTSLFISPGFEFRAVTHLVTNFHLPRSSLLMLVCAFGGFERVLSAYRAAIERRYRFYSYGDAMVLAREDLR